MPRTRFALLFSFILPSLAAADALPGDVYYSADVFQKFKYGPFASDESVWVDQGYADIALLETAGDDTSMVQGTVSTGISLQADAGLFEADIASDISVDARTGIFHQAHSDLTLDIYIRGATGTPYDITMALTGTLDASREGGAPGSLAPLNGVSESRYEDVILNVPNGGTQSVPLDDFEHFTGVTTAQILVGTETYSLARTLIITSRTSVSQAICILGCMTQAAQFHAAVNAHVTVNVYPGGGPTGAPLASRAALPLALAASPNPAHGPTSVSFHARPGTPASVDVFDVRGQRVARLYDGLATGASQSIPWSASNVPSGVYFLRLENGRESSTAKITLMK